MTTTAQTTPGIGHNAPPAPIDPIEELHAKLGNANGDLTKRRDELALAFDRLPAKIENDDEAGKVGDFVRGLDTLVKNAEAARTSAKAPFLALASAVDGFFAKITDPAKALKKKLAPRQQIYLDAKADAERRAREAEAERMRQEAQRKAEEAARAEEEARKAREEQERVRREEEAAFAAAARAKAEAERKAREAEEAKRRQDEEAAAKAKREAEESAAAAQAAMMAARAKSEEEAAVTARAESAEKEAAKAEATMDRAAAIERQADRLEESARGKPAGLARTRGDYGSVSTLQTRWVGYLESRKELDLDAIRAFIPEDALTSAINGFVRAGGRELRGALIREETFAQTR